MMDEHDRNCLIIFRLRFDFPLHEPIESNLNMFQKGMLIV